MPLSNKKLTVRVDNDCIVVTLVPSGGVLKSNGDSHSRPSISLASEQAFFKQPKTKFGQNVLEDVDYDLCDVFPKKRKR